MSSESKAIEAAVLSAADERFRKIAMIVSRVLPQFPDVSDYQIGEVVERMVHESKLECQGDPSHMRFAEVRLPRGYK